MNIQVPEGVENFLSSSAIVSCSMTLLLFGGVSARHRLIVNSLRGQNLRDIGYRVVQLTTHRIYRRGLKIRYFPSAYTLSIRVANQVLYRHDNNVISLIFRCWALLMMVTSKMFLLTQSPSVILRRSLERSFGTENVNNDSFSDSPPFPSCNFFILMSLLLFWF
jgi:hypothetical protein